MSESPDKMSVFHLEIYDTLYSNADDINLA